MARTKGSKNKGAKAEYDEEIETVLAEATVEEVKAPVIHPLGIDLGREDLNTVVTKLNEVIAHINK